MEKIVLHMLLIFSAILVLISAAVTAMFILGGKGMFFYLIPVAILGAGIWMFYGFLTSRKCLKEINKIGEAIDTSIETIKSAIVDSPIDLVKMGREHQSNLQKAMKIIDAKKEPLFDEKIDPIWDTILRDVPHDDPLKMKLKKKFFTIEFEDLN